MEVRCNARNCGIGLLCGFDRKIEARIIGKRKEEKGGYLFNELNARAVDTVAPSLMIIHVKIN